VIKLRNLADDRTNRQLFLNFCEILHIYQHSMEEGKFSSSARNSWLAENWALVINYNCKRKLKIVAAIYCS